MVHDDAISFEDILTVAMEIAGDITTLAKALEVSIPAIYSWRNGTRRPNRTSLDTIYQYINKNTTYVHKLNNKNNIVVADYANITKSNHSSHNTETSYAFIPLLDANLQSTGEEYAFRKTWLQKITANNEYAVFMFRNIGLQMKPLFLSGTMLLINPCNRIPIHKKIYLVAINGVIYVRRFFASNNASIFKVENNEFELQNFIVDKTTNLTVIGEVIWYCNEII